MSRTNSKKCNKKLKFFPIICKILMEGSVFYSHLFFCPLFVPCFRLPRTAPIAANERRKTGLQNTKEVFDTIPLSCIGYILLHPFEKIKYNSHFSLKKSLIFMGALFAINNYITLYLCSVDFFLLILYNFTGVDRRSAMVVVTPLKRCKGVCHEEYRQHNQFRS